VRRAAWWLCLLGACSAHVSWHTDATGDACGATAETELTRAISSGDCAESAGALVWVERDDGAAIPALGPGEHCFTALEHQTGAIGAGHACRAIAIARDTRRLPEERGEVALTTACAPRSALTDALLAELASCNAQCDVERCICSAACDVGCTDAEACDVRCPLPIDLASVVIGGAFACGIARDRASVVCWGEGDAAPLALAGWGETFEPGVAAAVLTRPEGEQILALDASELGLCLWTDRGAMICADDRATYESTTDARNAGLTVGRGFLCGGESIVVCVDTATGRPAGAPLISTDIRFPDRIEAGGTHVCALVQGRIYCWTPLATLPASCGASTPCPELYGCVERALGDRCEPVPLPFSAIGTWTDIDLGWDHACAINVIGELWCWGWSSADPDAWPSSPTEVAGVEGAREVSVGEEHVCVRQVGGAVRCMVPITTGSALSIGDSTLFPGPGAVESFAAGPDGVTCGVKLVDGERSRVECWSLETAVGPRGLLGRAHTRDLEPGALDVDAADQAVCP
jgi:hypothetical protein